MKNIWQDLRQQKQPFTVLAPMYDVTDLPFRRLIAECAPPDIFYTEFVSVDALNSPGRSRTLRHLDIKLDQALQQPTIELRTRADSVSSSRESEGSVSAYSTRRLAEKTDRISREQSEERQASPDCSPTVLRRSRPLVVQIWGKQADNFTKAADELVGMGFDGIDINFGCPVNNVIKNDCCSGLQQPHLRDKALDIINATKEGIAGRVPLSLKTRTGFNQVDFSWHEFLLEQKPEALIVHGRTTKQLSKVPANWDDIAHIATLRDRISPGTAYVGNGDVMDYAEVTQKAADHGVDGVMIGRGVFHDPFVFAQDSPWVDTPAADRIALYIRHIEYHQDFLGGALTAPLKKFAKIYLNGFDGAKDLRTRFMDCTTHDEMLNLLKEQNSSK